MKRWLCLTALILFAGLFPASGQELSKEEKDAGFVSMFNGKDLTDWMYLGKGEGSFSVQDGAIHYKGGNGWLCWTAKEYPDFELRLDFKLLKKGGDGGVFFRATKDAAGGANWPSQRYELQVKDYDEQARFWGLPYKLDKEKVAKVRKKLGEWESYRLIVQGTKVEAYLNGELVTTSDAAKPLKQAYIGLQAEGGEQAFRNLRVKALVPAKEGAAPKEGPAANAGGKVEITVLDRKTGQPVPCRIHLYDAAGKPQQAGPLPFFRDHFVCPGKVQLDLPSGTYTYEIERGPEHSRAAGTVTVKDREPAAVKAELERLANLPPEGWWAGDLHIHRPVGDIELLMRAEDLHVGPVITWWNNRNQWAAEKRLPEQLLTRFDDHRWFHVMAGEDEREGGALLYFNLPRPLAITGSTREFPSPMKFLAEARKEKRVWIDVEKPFWWDVPVWLASGEVDSIGLANNHMCRSVMLENEAWGRPRDRERLPVPLGNGYWSQEIYYHILNTGLRIPPSAGSASGVLPNPVGYNRVYVHTGTELSYDAWWDGLRAGRCFVTNGPLLRVEAGGKLPGHVFTGAAGEAVKVEVKALLTSRDPVRFLEIIKDGQVERKVPFDELAKTGSLGTVTFQTSGWFLVRALADNPKTFRFASTGPYYVEVGPVKRRISKASVTFFFDWVHERMKRIKLDDPTQRQEVLQHHLAAEKFWKDKLATANAD